MLTTKKSRSGSAGDEIYLSVIDLPLGLLRGIEKSALGETV
jgi:hypothetical protein